MSILSKRMSKIKPSATIAFADKAKKLKQEGQDIIILAAGEPDFPTPDNIKAAGCDAINTNKTNYTPVEGVPDLRKAICEKLERENGLKYSPSEIIVGSGAKQVLFNALLATLDSGDEVIIPAPFWVSYPEMVSFADATPVIISCSMDEGYKLTPAKLEAAITAKTKWLILNSPSNPTGAVYSEEELMALAEILLKHPHVHVMTDDIYEHIIFDGAKFKSIVEVEPSLKSRSLVVNGVSKSYSMTGWRIGYGAADLELIKAMAIVQSQSTSCATSISQYATIEALRGPQDFILERSQNFQKRRDLVFGLLNKIEGLRCFNPHGAFYMFVDASAWVGKTTKGGQVLKDSMDICNYMLEEVLVACVPGGAFGLEGSFRISFATSEALLIEACKRIVKAQEGLK